MENIANFASIVLVMVFYITMFLLTTVLLFIGIRKYLDKKKEKYAMKLISYGYKIETFNSRGVPHLLSKNKIVVTAWYGKEK